MSIPGTSRRIAALPSLVTIGVWRHRSTHSIYKQAEAKRGVDGRVVWREDALLPSHDDGSTSR
jgi:hypothetical protein